MAENNKTRMVLSQNYSIIVSNGQQRPVTSARRPSMKFLSSLLQLPAGLWHFNMSCLGVILQVRGCDGMSTPQNGAAAYLQSHVSRICQGGFPLLSL